MYQNVTGIIHNYISEVASEDMLKVGTGYFKHYVNTAIQDLKGFWLPTVAGIEITYNCKRHCRDCYVPSDIRSDNRVIDDAILRRAVSQLSKSKVSFTGFLGGEPISKRTIPLITSVVKDNPAMCFFIYTNGDYLSTRGLESLGELSNLSYSVSIDGFEKNHDFIRGKNSFKAVKGAFKELKSARKFYGASSTLRTGNADDLSSEYFFEFLANQGVKYVHIMKVKGSTSDFSDKDFKGFVEKILSFSKNYPFFLSLGSFDSGLKAIGRDFCYRDLFIDINGVVRVNKTDFSEEVGDITCQELSDIIAEIN